MTDNAICFDIPESEQQDYKDKLLYLVSQNPESKFEDVADTPQEAFMLGRFYNTLANKLPYPLNHEIRVLNKTLSGVSDQIDYWKDRFISDYKEMNPDLDSKLKKTDAADYIYNHFMSDNSQTRLGLACLLGKITSVMDRNDSFDVSMLRNSLAMVFTGTKTFIGVLSQMSDGIVCLTDVRQVHHDPDCRSVNDVLTACRLSDKETLVLLYDVTEIHPLSPEQLTVLAQVTGTHDYDDLADTDE